MTTMHITTAAMSYLAVQFLLVSLSTGAFYNIQGLDRWFRDNTLGDRLKNSSELLRCPQSTVGPSAPI